MQPGVHRFPSYGRGDPAAIARSALSFIAAILIILVFPISARPAAAASPDRTVQRLPVIDKQDIRFVPLSVGGEPFQKRVLSMAQDRYGFVWLGTDDGLYRYDGYTLRHYRHDPNDSHSLSDNTVFVLYKDHAGNLWIGTGYGGLDRFDPARDAFIDYRHDSKDSGSLRSGQVFSIHQDLAGSMWIGTNDGLDRLDVESGRFFHYPHPSDKPGTYAIWGLYDDRQGKLLVGCAQGLYNLEQHSGRFSLFSNSPRALDDPDVEWFEQDRSRALWFTSREVNLGTVDTASGELRRYRFNWDGSPKEHLVSRVHEDRDGVLWIGTVGDGLLKFDKERRNFVRYATGADNRMFGQIWALLEDSEGNIWVGGDSGVNRFQIHPPQFVNYQHDAHNPHSLRNDNVLSVHTDPQGFLWIGTVEGLQRLDRRTGQLLLYQHDPKNPNSLSFNAVSAIEEDGSGGLWIGTHGGGLNRFDRASGRFFAYRHDPKDRHSLSGDVILSLLLAPGGVLWIGTDGGGLNRFDPATGQFKAYRYDPRIPHSLSNDIVGTIFMDRGGTMWAGTNVGLDRFDSNTERFTVYLHDERDPSSLSNDGITSVEEDRQGALWIGTRHGLNRLDRTQGRFESFTTRDGLANDLIEGIREDSRGNVWLATHDGLSEFCPKTKTVRNYSEADGVPGDFGSPAGTNRSGVTAEGELIFGSTRGVTVFNPNQVTANSFSPPVVITDFLLFNKPVSPSRNAPLKQSIWATRAITLDHTQSILTLEFAALSYVAPEMNRYRYRLEPLEREWNEVGAERRVATYTNLQPGKYIFRVQGSNQDLLWNAAGTRLDITVLPPWWATWWFRSMALLSIAGLAFAAYRRRVRSLHLAAQRLESQVAQRTRELEIAKETAETANRAKGRFLAHMSHELRTPLNAILGFSNLVRESGVSESQRRDLDIVNRSGEHLLSLINDVLDVAKVESGRMDINVEACDLKRLVGEVTDMICVRANEKGLELRLKESTEFPRVARTDAGKLRQVLINLLGNAIKYTDKGDVTLRLNSRTAEDGQRLILTFEVEDTGIGIPLEDQQSIFEAFAQSGKQRTQKGTGLGLTITRQFVELMGGNIRLESTPGQGSRFCVELPAEQADESEVGSSDAQGDIVGVDPGSPDYRVLVVEDEEENWLVLHRLLEDSGFKVQLAENGARAVEVFQSWRPRFIWMDMGMPVMDGREATRRIRNLEGGREVKIAAATASAYVSERDEVLAAGADDFIRKPYRPSEIFDCMARHLGLQRIYRQEQREKPISHFKKSDLDALPQGMIRELRSAVLTLSNERIRKVIARISEHDAAAGHKLTYLADRLAYTPMLNLTEGLEAPETEPQVSHHRG